MKNFRIRSAAAGSVALLALLLTACDEAADTSDQTTDSEAQETTGQDGQDEAEPAAETEQQEETSDSEEEEQAESAEGTRDNPLALGSTVESGDWAVTINSFTPNADDQVAAENQFNDPAPEGHSYALVGADVTYTGEDSEMLMMGVEIAYVSSGGETIEAFDTMAMAPDELDSAAELYNGGTESGNVALAVPEDDDGLIRVRVGFIDQEDAFFSTE